MTEKINGQGLRPTDTAGARRTDAAKQSNAGSSAGKSAAAAPAATDTVNITRSGLLMTKLEEVVRGAPVVDAERVAALKDALASGKYEIDSQRIADRLLLIERNLLT